MARPKNYTERSIYRFAEGTMARIDAAKNEDEDRADFVRRAVERALTEASGTFPIGILSNVVKPPQAAEAMVSLPTQAADYCRHRVRRD